MYFKAESMLRTDNRRNQKPENKRFIVIFETFYKKIVTFKKSKPLYSKANWRINLIINS